MGRIVSWVGRSGSGRYLIIVVLTFIAAGPWAAPLHCWDQIRDNTVVERAGLLAIVLTRWIHAHLMLYSDLDIHYLTNYCHYQWMFVT